MKLRNTNAAIFVILTAAALTTIGVFSTPSVFAGKCDKNGDNSCNDNDINQQAWTNNKCELENLNTDHSNKNFDDNLLSCVNTVRNLEDLSSIPDQFASTS